jgi:pimeloyl-ACP methyl ester carboxylesterase
MALSDPDLGRRTIHGRPFGAKDDADWSPSGFSLASQAIDVEDVNVLYFHDVPTEVASEAFRRGEPAQSWTPMTQPWPLTAWPTVPTRALAGRDDRLFPVSFQQRIARQRLQLGVDLIVGGHLLALGHPRRLAEQLIAYIADVEAR